ncbi:MAG: diguanylate cyclase [Phototrophicales bacterium]|nr:MAG: diguanylate cyclase [Phototrophicales bacterium]RMG73176.1 MAG: ABC transporter permease [Chloroflexota bacterium]
MTKYIIRRIIQAIPLLVLITILIFGLLKLSGDPFAAQMIDPNVSEEDMAYRRRAAGLDDPLPLQFIHWYLGDDWYQRDLRPNNDPCLADSTVVCAWGEFDGEVDTPGTRKGILRGDFGISLRFQRPVVEVIQDRLPNTLILASTALTTTILLGVAIGMLAALRPYSLFDNIVTTLSFVTFSMPIFLIALLAVFVFSVKFKEWGLPYLPTQGMYDPRGDRSLDELLIRLILPTFSLAAIQIAAYSRFIRASMLEAINSDYIRTARAKGLTNRRIVLVHAFKNASFPLITLVALDIPAYLGGAVVTETIFSWPGMGKLFIDSLTNLDPPILLAFTLLVAVSVVFFQLLADIVYAWVDPRVRYT